MAKLKPTKEDESCTVVIVYEDSETKSIWTYTKSLNTNKSTLISVENIDKHEPSLAPKKKKKKEKTNNTAV